MSSHRNHKDPCVYINIPFSSSQTHVILFGSCSLCIQGGLWPEVIVVFNKKNMHSEISHPVLIPRQMHWTHSLTNQRCRDETFGGFLLFSSTCFVKWNLKNYSGTSCQKMLAAASVLQACKLSYDVHPQNWNWLQCFSASWVRRKNLGVNLKILVASL